MSEQMTNILKGKIASVATYDAMGAEVQLNTLKEELQYYVLHFLYHHPKYSGWVMYGGSALRIIHGLDRMSVDLDFEIADTITEKFLEELKKEVEDHFVRTYDAGSDFLTAKITAGRGLTLKFHVGDILGSSHSSKQVHVKIDLNHFVAPKTVTERRPINHGQLSFAVMTYNMGALMASKIAAIFLRDQRGVNKNMYDYKGRDIYDLLWYMGRKVTPDFDYLNAKLKEEGRETIDIKTLFDKLTVDILNYEKMDALLKDDLSHLFENPFQFEDWLKHWREHYLRYLHNYEIRTVGTLESAHVFQDLLADTFSFVYEYAAEHGGSARIVCIMSDYWIDEDISIVVAKKLEEKLEFKRNGSSSRLMPKEKLTQYATLFYQKTEQYFKKTNRIMLGDSITTKVIRMTADKLNPKEQIVLTKSVLLSCELDDLLK